MLLSFNVVYAAEEDDIDGICSSEELTRLKREARQIEFSHTFDNEPSGYRVYYMFVSVNNFDEKFYIEDQDEKRFYYMPNEDGEEDSSSYYLGMYLNGRGLTFKIYASDATDCTSQLLYTKKYQLPHYNDYSTREECKLKENKDFELCDIYYGGRVENDEEFETALKEYQAEKAKQEVKPKEEKKEESWQEKFIKLYTDNLAISILITIGVVILIIWIIYIIIKKIKNQKNKIKIDLEV